MKDILVAPQNGVTSKNTNCDFQKDALLGFDLDLDLPDEQMDSTVLQLQAAVGNTLHSNSNSNSNSNSVDYHQSLMHCVDLLPAMPPAPAINEAQIAPEPGECYAPDQVYQQQRLPECNNEMANKESDSLAKLAYSLWRLAKQDHIVIDRKRNEVVRTDAVTNQKTIYRCLDPINMGMRPPAAPNSSPGKVGRPRKRLPEENLPKPLPKKAFPEPQPAPTLRTRSGRLVRSVPPQTAATPASAATSDQSLDALVAELKDKNYRQTNEKVVAPETACPEPTEPVERPRRTVPANSICPGCNKIFLGPRLKRHYVKFPGHMPRPAPTPEEQQQQQQQAPPLPSGTSLFGLLTAQLQRHAHLSEEQRSDLFLHELNDFVEQLQLRSTRLIRNTSGLHFVNTRTARVLGIPEGQYALDMSAIESAQAPLPEPESQLLHTDVAPGPRNLVDYTGLSMSLDDTLTDEAAQRLNLSAGGKLLPPSEESLLRNVSDLMQPPVTVPATLDAHLASVNGGGGVGALLPHYDHVSDNAVEALSMKETPNASILDLNVDFFQFENN